MKVLLVYLNNKGQYSLPQGAAALAAVIRIKHKIKVIDTTNYFYKEAKAKIIQQMKQFRPDIVLFSSVSGVFKYGLNISKEIKKRFSKEKPFLVIFGGVHPTIVPEEVIAHNSIDAVCIGEGDIAIRDLLEKIENKKNYVNIKNFWFKKNGKIIKNPVRPLVDNLDKLPLPARDLLSPNHDLSNTGISIMATRGCPFTCPFCVNEYINKLYDPRSCKVRFKSVDCVLEEIDKAYQLTNVKKIYFVDDNFLANMVWLKEFCQKFPHQKGFDFACLSSVKLINEEKLKLLKKANCSEIILGIESGDNCIRNKVYQKDLGEEEIINAFNLIKKYKIRTSALYMLGAPFETSKSLQNTLEFNKKLNPDNVNVAIFVPFKKTTLRKIAIENSFLQEKKDEPCTFYDDTTLTFPDLKTKMITKVSLLMNTYQKKPKIVYYVYSLIFDLLALFQKERYILYLTNPKCFFQKIFKYLTGVKFYGGRGS